MAASSYRRTARWAILLFVLGAAIAPPLPLVWKVVGSPADQALWTPAFVRALLNGLIVAGGTSVAGFVLGMPLGLMTALYRFRSRRHLALIQVIPLLVPSFIPAIAWSNLAARGWFPRSVSPSGIAGAIFVLGFQAYPLPLFAVWAACRSLTASQVEAARLHGGERAVLPRCGRT